MAFRAADTRQATFRVRLRLSLIVGAATTAVTVAGMLFAVLEAPSPDSSQTNSLPSWSELPPLLPL
jgi:hypothetical protein